MKKLLRIGKFSEMNHISIQTIRFYDRIDLLKPFYVDPMTNYRYYHINQSSIVDAIQHLRQLNFSLKEIKLILSQDDPSLLNKLVEKHRQDLKEKELMLNRQQQDLKDFQASLQAYQEHASCQKLEIIPLPKRRTLSYTVEDNIYQMTAEEYELQLRRLKDKIQSYSPAFQNFGCIGSIMPQQSFLSGNWYSKEMIVLTQAELGFPFTKVSYLPQSLYAVSYCDSFQEELAALPLFLKAVQEADCRICGDYVCQVIYEHPKLTEAERKMFIRMQIPVQYN
ncbi:helix-turn-helix domain-containing protein [Streptococcus sp. H49]|uniref:MerR family transcriptional regulator n=1 Tax=Streptococcus huangxiaojuni TaxID=3237239 RepID=UPI0034A23F43